MKKGTKTITSKKETVAIKKRTLGAGALPLDPAGQIQLKPEREIDKPEKSLRELIRSVFKKDYDFVLTDEAIEKLIPLMEKLISKDIQLQPLIDKIFSETDEK